MRLQGQCRLSGSTSRLPGVGSASPRERAHPIQMSATSPGLEQDRDHSTQARCVQEMRSYGVKPHTAPFTGRTLAARAEYMRRCWAWLFVTACRSDQHIGRLLSRAWWLLRYPCIERCPQEGTFCFSFTGHASTPQTDIGDTPRGDGGRCENAKAIQRPILPIRFLGTESLLSPQQCYWGKCSPNPSLGKIRVASPSSTWP